MHARFLAHAHPHLVPFDGEFELASRATRLDPQALQARDWKQQLEHEKERLYDWQRKLAADAQFAMLLVFQAMDAGGKDSTIRHVLTGVSPLGVRSVSFKPPTRREAAHDFLWRITKHLPARGEIGVFNRSHYEEVLVARVRPELLEAQRVETPIDRNFWQARFRAINDYERHLAESGTVVLKFWLNVSKEEQRRRFMSRIERFDKHWKFQAGDLDERDRWDDYMHAYEACLNATSQPWAPWYAIPADHKPFMRWQVARLINDAFEQLGVDYPAASEAEREEIRRAARRLEDEPSQARRS